MIIYLLACIASFFPCAALYFWQRNGIKKDKAWQKLCDRTLWKGVLSVFPIVLLSGICFFSLKLIKIQETHPLLYEMLYTFIVLALAEEIVKYRTFKSVLQKTDYPCSWLDIAMLSTIVGIGFGCIESVVYMLSASVPVVLIRGLCVPHAGYGFVVGYFYGKGLVTGKPKQRWIGFALAWFIHGLYDFSLSEEFAAINDNLMIVALALAVLDILLVINLIVFVHRAKKREECTQPLSNSCCEAHAGR